MTSHNTRLIEIFTKQYIPIFCNFFDVYDTSNLSDIECKKRVTLYDRNFILDYLLKNKKEIDKDFQYISFYYIVIFYNNHYLIL